MKNLATRNGSPSFTFALAAALAGVMLAAPLRAEDAIRYKASPLGSKVRIAGSANIHDWTMDGTIIGGFFEVPADIALDSSQAAIGGLKGDKIMAKAEVLIPVNSMQSGTQGMDEVMQHAMNADQHPRIVYQLTDLVFKGPHTAGTPFQFDSKGELIVNGVTNRIAMPVTIESASKTKLKIAGSVPMKITDYKVVPPTKLGVFKTYDDIKISFEWVVTRHDKPAETK